MFTLIMIRFNLDYYQQICQSFSQNECQRYPEIFFENVLVKALTTTRIKSHLSLHPKSHSTKILFRYKTKQYWKVTIFETKMQLVLQLFVELHTIGKTYSRITLTMVFNELSHRTKLQKTWNSKKFNLRLLNWILFRFFGVIFHFGDTISM